MAQRVDQQEICPMRAVQSAIAGKWKVIILRYLGSRTYRFNELHRSIGDISVPVLHRQLQELEASGLVLRTVLRHKPLQVSYGLSGTGASLYPILQLMNTWGQDHMAIPPSTKTCLSM